MKLQPLGSDVMIHAIESPSITEGGIYVPETARKLTNQGIILKLGPRVGDTDLTPGDHVCFNAHSGNQVAVRDGGIFYFIPIDLIVAKFDNSETPVILTDTMSVKRVISERIGEMKTDGYIEMVFSGILDQIEQDLHDRIDQITLAEGFIF